MGPQNAADLSSSKFFLSVNSPNQSIDYDFKDNQAGTQQYRSPTTASAQSWAAV
jgi:hypothetical protein